MFGIDTVYDVWRLGNLLIGAFCLVWLVGGLIKQKDYWNVKTRDLWYSRLMYAVLQIVLSAEGIYYGRDSTYSLAFVTAAGLVTAKGLYKKGAWGYDPEDLQRTR